MKKGTRVTLPWYESGSNGCQQPTRQHRYVWLLRPKSWRTRQKSPSDSDDWTRQHRRALERCDPTWAFSTATDLGRDLTSRRHRPICTMKPHTPPALALCQKHRPTAFRTTLADLHRQCLLIGVQFAAVRSAVSSTGPHDLAANINNSPARGSPSSPSHARSHRNRIASGVGPGIVSIERSPLRRAARS